MTTRTKVTIGIISIIFLLTPLTIYFIHFQGQQLSNNAETWGQFGDYLNGTFMPIIALVGVFVTLLLGLISDNRNQTNIKIEQQKQRPLLHIGYVDSELKVRIFMRNKGNGPLIIYKYRLINLETNSEIEGIYNCLPGIQRNYDNYTGSQTNTVLSSNEEQELILLEKQEEEDETVFEEAKTLLRQALSQYKVVVDYKYVYDNKMPTYERSLKWFGRHENE